MWWAHCRARWPPLGTRSASIFLDIAQPDFRKKKRWCRASPYHLMTGTDFARSLPELVFPACVFTLLTILHFLIAKDCTGQRQGIIQITRSDSRCFAARCWRDRKFLACRTYFI